MNRFLAWLKKLTHRTKNQKVAVEQSSITAKLTISNEPAVQNPIAAQMAAKMVFQPSINFEKTLRQERISKVNGERQKNTMGYSLKTRNFRPRPAAEKRLWDMQKKPAED